MFRIQTSAGEFGGYDVVDVVAYLVNVWPNFVLNCGYDTVEISRDNDVKLGDMLIRNRVIDVDENSGANHAPECRIFNDHEWAG